MEPESWLVRTETPAPRAAHRAVWLAWGCALLSILISLLALLIAVRGAFSSGAFGSILSHQSMTPFITVAYAVIGALIASRHPRSPIGWIFAVVGILYALSSLASAISVYGGLSFARVSVWADWFGAWFWIPAVILPLTFILLIFPGERVPSPRWRAIAWCSALGIALVTMNAMLENGPLAYQLLASPRLKFLVSSPLRSTISTLGGALLAVGMLGSLASFVLRFRRSRGVEREQMMWLAFAVAIMLLSGVVGAGAYYLWPENQWAYELSIALTNLGILSIAVAAAIAILRHGLYDIHLIINRTLVYSALTVGVAALYGLVVGALGLLFQGSNNLLVALVATGLAAVLLQPMRERLQKLVNRLMYGERDDPYTVLASLSRRLEASLSPETAIPAVVETVAQTLRLPYVAVLLKQADGLRIAASYGQNGTAAVQLPLSYQGEMVGQLHLSARGPNQPFTPGEQRLLEDIARHIGVIAHSVLLTQDLRRLADDLQRSREELVKSREEERRRLRRDLHDDLGPQLASLKLNLDVARNLVTRDPPAAEALLVDLRAHSQSAIADIRRLVFDLRPPALDELGLVGAIQEYARQIDGQDGLRVRLDSPAGLPPLPAAVEVAAYRITLEALANFVRHSQGKNCRVALSVSNQQLQVEIRDDGLGLPEPVAPGVGLSSMRERAAELGGSCRIERLPQGGTRVLACLPLA